ncbi:MAG: hypothetical protein ACON5F_12525 [Jejuia sp.]
MDYLLQERLKLEYGSKNLFSVVSFKNVFDDVFNINMSLQELNHNNNIA